MVGLFVAWWSWMMHSTLSLRFYNQVCSPSRPSCCKNRHSCHDMFFKLPISLTGLRAAQSGQPMTLGLTILLGLKIALCDSQQHSTLCSEQRQHHHFRTYALVPTSVDVLSRCLELVSCRLLNFASTHSIDGLQSRRLGAENDQSNAEWLV